MDKENKIEDFRATWVFFWKFVKPTFKKIRWTWFLLVFIVAATLIEPSIYRLVVDELAKSNSGGMDFYKILMYLGFWAVVGLVNLIVYSIYRLTFSYHMPDIERDYIAYSIENILGKDLKKHLEKKSGEMMKDADRASDFFWQIPLTFYNNVLITWLNMIVVLIFAFYTSWQMTLVLLSTLPFYILLFVFVTGKTHKMQVTVYDQYTKAYGYAHDAVANISVVKSFAKELFEHKRFIALINGAANLQRGLSMRWGALETAQFFMSILTRMVVFIGGAFLIKNSLISVGVLIMFLSFSGTFYAPWQQLGDQIRNFQRGFLAIEKARKILEIENEVLDSSNAKDLKVNAGKVELKGVSFTYKKIGILKNISLVIEPGQVVALVGHSGAGKSTIISLINRFYDLNNGQILIDGQDIAKVKQQSLRANLGLVMQDNSLFNATVLDNIRYAKPKATLKMVRLAAKQANIDDFIMALPEQYNTKVGERGLKLSGGEKQRVAIARMILKNPPIVILDEATSALDSQNEKIIQGALEKLMKGRTSIVIAHRLSTVRKADKIYVMHKGRLAQAGSHTQLMKQGGLYKELVDLQVNGLLAE